MLHTLLLLALSSRSRGDETFSLTSVNDFIGFANNVESGTDYSGTTVLLGADITLPDSIDPIGTSHKFRGTFDGKGHVISNLTMNPSSLKYAGLFGFSDGLTITNVVLDDSCSIINSFKSSDSDAYIGGILGGFFFWSDGGNCNIENCVNMADVSFSGDISKNMYIGGIAGYLSYSYHSGFNVYVKNCVNYGSVTHSGTTNNAGLGGVVGYSQGSSSYNNHIQNCLNYGAIIHDGTTSANLNIGGIVGNSVSYTYIENCVSAGKISTQTTAPGNNYIGSIVGEVDSDTYINYCYYTSDVSVDILYGTGTPSSTTGTFDIPTTMNSGLVTKLNSNATSCNWDNWFMLHLNGGSINNLAQDLLVEIQGHIPNPVKERYSFLHWCKDAECTEKFDPETETVDGITGLHAVWTPNNYTVIFDFGNGTTVKANFTYNTEITYPEDLPEKEGYTSSWDKYHGPMPAEDITVTVAWTPNNYNVTFNVSGGNELSGGETTKNVTFNEKYGILPEPSRTGYSFTGWFNENDELITSETTVTTPKNHTLHANWTANNYTVTFNVSGGDELSGGEDTKNVTFNEEYSDLPEPTRDGYTFAGWLNENDELITNETIVITPKNHALHANWSGNTYIVSLDADGGGGVPTSEFVVFGDVYGELPTPKKTGCTFLGWFTETPGGNLVDSSTTVASPYNHIIYAHWDPIQYTISFDPRGGSACGNISQSYGTRLTLPKPEMTGYAFLGWFDADLTTAYSAKTVQAENVTLYAKWEPNTYTVSFDEDCGIYNDPISVTFDSTYNLAELAAGKPAILWWEVEETGEMVEDGDEVRIADDIKLCAVWKTNTVTLDANGGDVSPATIDATYDETYDKLPIPSRTGYSFLGWFNENGESVTDETKVTTPKNHTLYAHWTAIKHIITFDFGNGKTTQNTQRYGDVIIYPNEVPSKSFHKFRRWCTKDAVANSDGCNVTYVPANDLTFTASFDVDSSLVAGSSATVVAVVLVIILLVLVLVHMKVVRKMRRNYDLIGVELDEEDEKTPSERVEGRMLQQVEAIKISNSFAKSLKSALKKAEKDKGLDEVLADLGVEGGGSGSDYIIESFRAVGAVHAAVAAAVHKKEDLIIAAEYLMLLYTTVRAKEEYEEFDELYFGMKDISNFMGKMDEETISFSGIVSGFTNKIKAIQSLMTKDENESNNMPSGVLFKVKKGRGYKIGKIDEETDEVLFELNSVFKVESVREVTKDRLIAAALSFISPATEDEIVKL